MSPSDSVPARTAAEMATLCGGQTASDAVLTHVSSPERASSNSLLFAENEASLKAALASQAGAILVSSDLAAHAPDSERLIVVANPRLCFARCARLFQPERAAAQIHPSAVVHTSARIGQRPFIGPGVVVEADAVLGDDVVLGARAVVGHGVQIGHRAVVQAGAVLGSTGFGYVRDPATGDYMLFPQQGDLVLEDDVEIGANTTVDRGALGETRIGRGTKVDNLVHIAHNCNIGRNVIIAAQVGISGSTVVEDGAVIAGQVGLGEHTRVGSGVILGGQSGVYSGKTIRGPGQVFAGTPAEPLKEHMRSLAKLRRLK